MLPSNNRLTIYTLLGYLSTFSALLFANIINILIESSLLICTYPRDLSREAYCKYKSEISEHGAFPLVSVQVQHEEPGNVHPYNFEPISPAKTLFWAKLL